MTLHFSTGADDELRQMQDIRNQRLQFIRGRDGRDSGTYQAVMWLKDNQHRFKQPILEPIALVVSVCVGGGTTFPLPVIDVHRPALPWSLANLALFSPLGEHP